MKGEERTKYQRINYKQESFSYTGNLANYRLISLLYSMHKTSMAILQKRIAVINDPYLQKTQYVFQKHKSTAHAVDIIRRILDLGERTDQKLNLVLLDWEKAFGKVSDTGYSLPWRGSFLQNLSS